MPTLADFAHDFALDLAEDAQTGDCDFCPAIPEGAAGVLAPRFGFVDGRMVDTAHRLGTKLDCPTCWAWHAARKQPHPDQRAYVRAVLAEQRELAGEDNLDVIAQEIAGHLAAGVGPAIDRTFFDNLESLAIRCCHWAIKTTRRQRAIRECIGFIILDPQVAVGARRLAA
jgi:hypothetical protein